MKVFIFFVSFCFTAVLADLKPMIDDMDPIITTIKDGDKLVSMESSTIPVIEHALTEPKVEIPSVEPSHIINSMPVSPPSLHQMMVEVERPATELLPPKYESIYEDKWFPVKNNWEIKTYDPLFFKNDHWGYDKYMPFRDMIPRFDMKYNTPYAFPSFSMFRNYYEKELMPVLEFEIEKMLYSRPPMPYKYTPLHYNRPRMDFDDYFDEPYTFHDMPIKRKYRYNNPMHRFFKNFF